MKELSYEQRKGMAVTLNFITDKWHLGIPYIDKQLLNMYGVDTKTVLVNFAKILRGE